MQLSSFGLGQRGGQRNQSPGGVRARAVLVADAASELSQLVDLRGPMKSAPAIQLASSDSAVLRRWYNDCVEVIHRMRNLARERAARGDHSVPLPEYPRDMQQVHALIGRLASDCSSEGAPNRN